MTKNNFFVNLKQTLKLFSPFVKYLKKFRLFYLGSIISLILSLNLDKLFNDKLWHGDTFLFVLCSFLLAFLLPVYLEIKFVIKCFRNSTKVEMLNTILHTYIAGIIIFSGVYYQCALFGDLIDANIKYTFYHEQKYIKKHIPDWEYIKAKDNRAFVGMDSRLWSGYDYPNNQIFSLYKEKDDLFSPELRDELYELDINQIMKIVDLKKDDLEVIKLIPDNQKDVFFECLYFSTLCISTGGFGEISPNVWYTKLFASVEILIGVTLFVFAIGMMFGDRNEFRKKVN